MAETLTRRLLFYLWGGTACLFLLFQFQYHNAARLVLDDTGRLDSPKMTDVSRLSPVTLHRNDSSDATVMSMAQGYDMTVHQRFVGSLRKSGFKGNILLAVEPTMKDGVEDYLTKMNVTMLKLNYTTCDNPIFTDQEMEKRGHRGAEGNTCIDPYPDVKIRWGRYPLLRDALRQCTQCTGPVLVTDARDVLFQRDPFGDYAPEIFGLQFYAEHHTIDAGNWFVRKRVDNCRGTPMRGPMLCSGTTIGTREAMLSYMDIMYEEMKYWMTNEKCLKIKSHGGDQAIMNYLYYSGQFNHLDPQINHPRNGIVNTVGFRAMEIVKQSHRLENMAKNQLGLGKQQSKVFSLFEYGKGNTTWLKPWVDIVDENGYFIDLDGSPSRVVHQFDRMQDKAYDDWLARGILYDIVS